MSVNTAHANGGVLIHSGEFILLHSKNAHIKFSGQQYPIFHGTKHGYIYLTSHRMLFRSRRKAESLLSFSAPFIAMSDVKLQQPILTANYLEGKVRAQPNGNYDGEINFKLYFKSGGAIEYAQALLCATSIVLCKLDQSYRYASPPPYIPPRVWYEASLPAYQLPTGYYNWLPTNKVFTSPEPNSVFMTDNPAPYPGIGRASRQCRQKLLCESFESEACPTSIHSIEGLRQPPIYGVFTSSHQDGTFPHQAAYPLFSQSPNKGPELASIPQNKKLIH